MTELETKLSRVREFLGSNHIDAIVYNTLANVAWITCGGDAHVTLSGDNANCHVVVTRKGRYVLANNIERPRLVDEELGRLGFEIVEYPWWEDRAGELALRKIVGRSKVVSDNGAYGTMSAAGKLAELRYSLTPHEIKRYRVLGALVEAAMRASCLAIEPGQTEFEIKARMLAEVSARGMTPTLALVATDERVRRYRHPIAKAKKLRKYGMFVICARKYGLWVNLTRIVHFGKVPADLRRRHDAVCKVDAAFNLTTRIGRRASDIFRTGAEAYAATGFADEWKLHHQGGATGYTGRDWFANLTSSPTVQPNQAFAWNPSITGTKSEDTVLVTERGIEVLTPAKKWPMIKAEWHGQSMVRPDILVR